MQGVLLTDNYTCRVLEKVCEEKRFGVTRGTFASECLQLAIEGDEAPTSLMNM